MNVLSLFDGMACGRQALHELGFPVTNYFAAEIDKYAMRVALNNHLDIQHIGDVTKVDGCALPDIDLLIGGSPCQGFSFAGKQLNFEDPRSKLFFEFVRLLKECKPKYFFLENVVMKKEYQDVISKYLGVEPIMLNSSLVSAQSRKRLYWTNIPGYVEPEDKSILLKHIVHEHVDLAVSAISSDGKAHCLTARYSGAQVRNSYEKKQRTVLFESTGRELVLLVPEATSKGFTEAKVGDGIDLTFLGSKTRRGRLMRGKSNCLTASNYDYNLLEELRKFIVPFDKTLQILEKEIARGKVGYFRKDSQANRVYYIHDKAVTLCGDAGGGAAKMGQYLFGEVRLSKSGIHQACESKNFGNQPRQTERVYNIEGKSPALTLESSRIMGAIPIDVEYLFGCITPDRVDKRQNGQRFNDGQKFYTLTAQDKHGILIEGYIRKLTPIECERLQTLPDNYTAGVSNSQRYKMLGNGWTVEAVKQFFKNIPIDSLDLF